MTDFDALLKRSFAEAHEPADDGFAAHVGQAVARREAAFKVRAALQIAGIVVACAALSYGAYAALTASGPELLATLGLEVARAHGALSTAPSVGNAAQGLMQALGAGLTQVLLVTAALAGGAVAYRAAQED